jgi:hypothetical protein
VVMHHWLRGKVTHTRILEKNIHKNLLYLRVCLGAGYSVSIVTDYGLDGPGIESRWGEIFRTRPDQPWGPPSLLYNGYWVFPRAKAAGAWCWPPTPS